MLDRVSLFADIKSHPKYSRLDFGSTHEIVIQTLMEHTPALLTCASGDRSDGLCGFCARRESSFTQTVVEVRRKSRKCKEILDIYSLNERINSHKQNKCFTILDWL